MKTLNLNPYDIQEMRRTMSSKEIAAHYQIPVQTLYHWCYRNNVLITRITDYEIEEGLKLHTVKELAYYYNVTIGAIYARAKKLGITIGSIYDEDAIQDLRQRGYSYKEIAAAMGYNYGSMMNKRYKAK